MIYKQIKTLDGTLVTGQIKLIYSINEINKIDETIVTMYIPFDPANSDYQQYLKWLAEGNTPLPADEGITQ